MVKQQNILFISFSPLDGNGGGIYATRAYVNALAELYAKVTLLYPTSERPEQERVDERVRKIPVSDPRSKGKKALGYLLGKVHRFEQSALQQLECEKYDIVVFNNSTCSHRLLDKFKAQGVKVVTIHHNYQMEYVKADFPWYLKYPTLFWTNCFEGRAARRSDMNIVLTEQDAQLIQHHYRSKQPFEVLGVFEYQRSSTASLNQRREEHVFAITGGLSDPQTASSLTLWMEQYYPVLKRLVPDAQVIIAGKNPSNALSQSILNHGIELIPSPPDMDAILERANFYLCPIDRGGGLKLRNMDGLRHGLPVLTHRVSARGYEALQKLGCMMVYDSPDTFAVALEKLMCADFDPQQVRKAYEESFSFDAGVRRMERVMNKLN